MGCKVEIRKIMSHIATCNGLKPITSRRGVAPEIPAVETPPFRVRRGHIHITSIIYIVGSVLKEVVLDRVSKSYRGALRLWMMLASTLIRVVYLL